MLVEITQDGADTSRISIDGTPVLNALRPFKIERATEVTRLTYEPPKGAGYPDALCGSLPILYRRQDGDLATCVAEIKPPLPFTSDHIALMWQAVKAVGMGLPASVSWQGKLLGVARSRELRLDKPVATNEDRLKDLHSTTRRLLNDWPLKDAMTTAWIPVDTSGGREDAASLERRPCPVPGQFNHITRDLRILKTPRKIATSIQWTSRRVLALSRECLAILTVMYPDFNEIKSLSSSLSMACAFAEPRASSEYEPPFSALPERFQEFVVASQRFLSDYSMGGDREDYVPACDLWRLYEKWLIAHFFKMCEGTMGAPSSIVAPSRFAGRWIATWVSGRTTLVFEPQKLVTQAGGGSTSSPSNSIESVTRDLIPDICITVWQEGTEPSHLLLDAKARGSNFTADEAAMESAKYLWGMRRKGDPSKPMETVSVFIVSPISPGSPYDEEKSRMRFLTALPEDTTDVETSVNGWINERLQPRSSGSRP